MGLPSELFLNSPLSTFAPVNTVASFASMTSWSSIEQLRKFSVSMLLKSFPSTTCSKPVQSMNVYLAIDLSLGRFT